MTVSCTVTGLGSVEESCTDGVKTCVSKEVEAEDIIVEGPIKDEVGRGKSGLVEKGKLGTERRLVPGEATGRD